MTDVTADFPDLAASGWQIETGADGTVNARKWFDDLGSWQSFTNLPNQIEGSCSYADAQQQSRQAAADAQGGDDDGA